jgi:glycosyltransferase involved in cell wall biosynthesis
MRVAYVIQRYGRDIGGGAEQHCRELAERLAARGHDVHVVTTCARSYVDWANAYEPGDSVSGGLTLHRFPVASPRDPIAFDRLTDQMLGRSSIVPMAEQRDWITRQGPHAPGIIDWLRAHGKAFDCIIFFTFLYWPTWAGLRACAGAFPTVLHPTVHDEPPLRFSIFDQVSRAPDAFAWSSPEEIELVARRFHVAPRGAIIGIGVELERAKPETFRRAHPDLGDAPYLLYVGRVDEGKGARELYDYFVAYKRRHPGRLRLVYLGEQIAEFTPDPDVTFVGYVDDATRDSALAGALALVQPSHFESFSMILVEAFAQRRPAVVQGGCAVLRGHASRSNAALPYRDAGEFEAGVARLETETGLADELGARGRAYVERNYTWGAVLDRYETLLAEVAARGYRA